MLLTIVVCPSFAQSELEKVEAETQAIRERVDGSKAQLEALQARLASGDPTSLRLFPMQIAEGYVVEKIEYFVDGEPVGSSVDGVLQVEVPAGGTLTARMVVRAAHDGFLSSYAFRMQQSYSAGALGGSRELRLVMSGASAGRPSLAFEPSEH